MAKTKAKKESRQNGTPRQIERCQLKIHTAVNYYYKISQSFEEIAKLVNVPKTTVEDWFKSEDWQAAKHFWRLTGEKPTTRRKAKTPPPEVPHTLTEKYLLEEAFQKDGDNVRFVTYKGFIDAKVETVEIYDIKLQGLNEPLAKHNILFAFPKRKMVDLKRGVKRRKQLADKNLAPIVKRSERPRIPVKAKIGDTIECVMRNGLVISGINIWTSKYNIVLRIGGMKKKARGKVALIYRHGLHEFHLMESNPPDPRNANDDWEDE